jgi:hypothetical protein
MAQKRKLVPQKAGALDKRRRPRGLTRAIRTAIDAMIYDRCTRAEACERAKITERALYLALEKPEVAEYWRRATDVLRTGERAANLHALIRVRDSTDEAGRPQNANASVKAVQVIEALDEQAVARPASSGRAPGLVIVIQGNVKETNTPPTIDNVTSTVIPAPQAERDPEPETPAEPIFRFRPR